ncbi:hypothetical protein ACJMK2_008904 [Sinanodonta woodiana]|uniref:Translocon-associated protein subunit alpha n=1 Tax=Sinanodonta woodiana TaxID=1069815 RepID=A0ABD3VAM8_SINWO
MISILGRFILLLLLVLPATILLVQNERSHGMVVLGDDPVEGEEDDEATVETEDVADDEEEIETPASSEAVTEKAEEDAEEEPQVKPSEHVDAVILFTKPPVSSDLPAGFPVRFLVSFKNNGEKDFTVESLEASFRYPQDFSFYIQNYTTAHYHQVVESKREATFDYGFTPSESYNNRPFGLTILLNYKDSDGNVFQNAVFNETVNVVESDEGLDGETFFLYLFLVAVVVLLIVGAQQLLSGFGRKHLPKSRQPKVEMGTQNTDVDYSWLPQETLQELNRTPKQSPKQSPRKRRSKRTSGSGEE